MAIRNVETASTTHRVAGDFSMTNVSKNDVFSKNRPTLDGTEKSKLPEMSANVSEMFANISEMSADVSSTNIYNVTGCLKKRSK